MHARTWRNNQAEPLTAVVNHKQVLIGSSHGIYYQCSNTSKGIVSAKTRHKKDKRQVNEKILQIVEVDIGIA